MSSKTLTATAPEPRPRPDVRVVFDTATPKVSTGAVDPWFVPGGRYVRTTSVKGVYILPERAGRSGVSFRGTTIYGSRRDLLGLAGWLIAAAQGEA